MLCLALPAVVFADVRIVLKNGRSITAESCVEKSSAFVCSIGGGSFSIDKGDVAGIRGISSAGSSAEGKTVIERPSDQGKKPGKALEGKKIGHEKGSAEKDLRKRLGEIRQRKMELKGERAKLLKERRQLKADLDKAPDWMTEKRFHELSGRRADLDKKIKGFNKEVSVLDKEEKKVREQLDGSAGKTVKKKPAHD